MRLVWNDATCDVEHDSGEFPDAAAVMFAMGEEVAALPMGVEVAGYTPASPVNAWQWKASRQFDTSTGRRHDSTDPRTLDGDGFYLFGPAPSSAAVASPALVRGEDLRLLDPYNLAAARAGNPHAAASVVRHAVLEANALGFGTLTYQPPDLQDTNASVLWTNGRWFVTAFRTLRTGDEGDVDLESPCRVPVAFAVWDGSRGDRAGMKSGFGMALAGDRALDRRAGRRPRGGSNPMSNGETPARDGMSVTRRRFLQAAVASGAVTPAWRPGLGGFVAGSGIDNPLKHYPRRDWERVYRDQYAYDRTFTFVCVPNDTSNCRLRAFVGNGVFVRAEQNYETQRVGDLYGNRATAAWNPRGCAKGYQCSGGSTGRTA